MNVLKANNDTTRVAASKQAPRGYALVGVLVCFAVVALLAGSLLTSSVSQQRQLRRENDRLQAVWLAESAVGRAAARLAADADYTGEQWRVAAELLDGKHDGLATIRVERVDDRPDVRRVRVEAHYPDDPVFRARATKEVLVRVAATEDSP